MGDAVAVTNPRPEVPPLVAELARYEHELTGYCYRMLGSACDAEDAFQETLVRAWRAHERFDGRSSLRTWLYRIATNICLDQLAAAKRRARPIDLTDPTTHPVASSEPLAAESWIEPVPDAWLVPVDGDPAGTTIARETVQLAFLTLLQHLPPWQRAAFLLREVVGLSAREIADLIGSSPASVNSALQRARSTLASARSEAEESLPVTSTQAALLAQYVAAFERFDLDALTMLLHVDATLSMPPYKQWMRGPDSIRRWLEGPGVGCCGSRLVRTFANGAPAFGQYRPSESGPGFDPWALHVLEISGGRISGINAFRATDPLFEMFGLPNHLAD